MPVGTLIKSVKAAMPVGCLAALAVMVFLFAGPDHGAPPALAQTTTAVSVAADLPVGTGFDFYVLALSWSPAYCRAEGPGANKQQCAADRDLGFVVHGLWPQFENGYPEFCPTREPDRVPSRLGRNYTDIVPSMGLIGHQWRKHGSCSGLSQNDYFGVLRAARERVRLPPAFAPENLPEIPAWRATGSRSNASVDCCAKSAFA